MIETKIRTLKINIFFILNFKKGINYYLQIRMKDAACKKNCDNEICNIVVYVRPWEDYRELTNFTCKKIVSQRPLGALSEIEKDDADALKALEFGIKSLNEKSNDLFVQQLVRVEKAFRQVVAGWNYSFEITMGRSNCTKSSNKTTSECGLTANSKLTQCKVSIWDQPWLGESRYKMTRSEC